MKLEIPWEKLDPATLRRMIEHLVMGEGTDYGHQAFTMDEKVGMVMNALRTGEALITWDQETESCFIRSRDNFSGA